MSNEATVTRVGLSRRSALRLLVGAGGLGLASACAPTLSPAAPTAAPKPTEADRPAATTAPAAAQPAPAPTTAGAPTPATAAPSNPAAQPKSGGTLRVADVDPLQLDGHLILTNGINITWIPYDRLTQYDDKLQPQPSLAESFELSKDAKQVKFSLRKGVQFHSGRELSSDDVKWNVLRVRDPKIGVAQLATQSNWFTGIETPDKYTIVLTTEQPRPFLFDFFEYFNILDRESMEGPPEERAKQIGTGPFLWQEYRQNQSVRLVKNKNYWRSGLPYLDEVFIQFIPDQQAAVVALEVGQIDMLAPPARDVVRLRQDPKYRLVVNQGSGRHILLAVNTTMAPGDDKATRQALSWALDRKRIAEQVLQGFQGEGKSLPWPKNSPAYDAAKDQYFSFDPDKAKSLLGGRTDVPVEITVNSANADFVSIAQIHQQDLARAGFKPTIKAMDGPAILQYADQQKNPGLWVNSSGYANMGPQAACTLSRHWNIGPNAEGFASEQYRTLVNGIATEADPGRRAPLYAQLNDFLLDQQFIIVVAPGSEYVMARANVEGMRWYAHGARVYSEVWLS